MISHAPVKSGGFLGSSKQIPLLETKNVTSCQVWIC